MHRLRLPAFICALALVPVLAPPGAFAQDEIEYPAFNGVAVAQAPEAGLGVCFGPDAAETMACAQDKCMDESGLGPQDCGVNLWCWPHGWVADVFMQHEEGPHWHSFVCNANTREELDLLVEARCSADYLMECAAVRFWDMEGNEIAAAE